MAGPHAPAGRVYKRNTISDQQKRRESALKRQNESRWDSQQHARRLAASALSLSSSSEEPAEVNLRQEEELHVLPEQPLVEPTISAVNDHVDEDLPAQAKEEEEEDDEEAASTAPNWKRLDDVCFQQATKLKGARARQWFAHQLMLPEWMIDIPPRLKSEWYVLPRPAGKRCLVVSSNGTTVSRLRNGRILHCFPSALPNGARTKSVSGPGQMFCILDCIFHEADQSYYVIDMICWRGYSLYDCSVEFRFFWLNSKLAETGACDPPSTYHRYQFHVVPIYDCDRAGLQDAYNGPLSYIRDGLLFCNRHAHYELGLTPLSLVWKDENCSQYLLDTDSNGIVPIQQHVVLELQEDGSVSTIDDPPVILASMPQQFLQQNEKHLKPGSLLRFAVGDQGLHIIDGKPLVADLHFQGAMTHARAFADSCSKILFQYAARHSPLTFEDLLSSVDLDDEESDTIMEG